MAVAAALAASASPTAHAQGAPATGLAGSECTSIDEAVARLACYDRVHGRASAPKAPHEPAPTSQPAPGVPAAARDGAAALAAAAARATPAAAAGIGGSGLAAVWELEEDLDQGTFRMLPHRANYLLPVRYTTHPNRRPSSPALDHSVTEDLPVRSIEAKFQFSFKFKAISSLLGDNGDVWLGYTQQSHWQVYNDAFSSPFRETNYEPEVILMLRTGDDVLGWRWRHVNIGLAHQSNGRGLPLSRSWNRVYAQFGLERGHFTLQVRPWIRFAENDETDDNPDIRAYYGSADLRLTYTNAGHVVSALGRRSLVGHRGALQLDWAFPIHGALKGYVQLTSGFGENLIDYNHKQNTLGIGVLLLPWQ